MKTRLKQEDNMVICYVSGEINIESISELRDVFKKIISDGMRRVILNFRHLDYIDSAGLASLIEFSKELKNIQGVLFLSDLSPKVSSLLAITKLESVFKIYETEDEALKDSYGY